MSLSANTGSIDEHDSLCPMKWRRRHTGSRLLETRSRQVIWEVTPCNLLPSTLASHLITDNGNIYWPLARVESKPEWPGTPGERIFCRYGVPARISSRLVLWRWRNNGGTWTLLETAFTSYFLSKVSYEFKENHFEPPLRLLQRNLFTPQPSTFKYRWITQIT